MGYRISTDTGGTFTDLALAENNVLLGRYKSPTTPGNLSEGIFDCIALAARDRGLTVRELLSATDIFVHGSTVATNAIIEGKGVKCGVICTAGTKYTLWRGEGRRKNIFDFKTLPPKPLIRPYLCLEVEERIDSEGQVLVPLDERQVRDAVRQLKAWDVKAIAVCLLWSVINPVHERRVAQIIREEWPQVAVSLSSEVQPILREYHRMSCTALNAMLQPIVSAYLSELESALARAGFSGELLIVGSDGGVMPVEEAVRRPVYMLFSGPSTGPLAGFYYARLDKQQSCLVIDMGGTSFDVSTVLDGNITTTKDGRILNYPTGVAANEILTLGAGGGSIAWLDSVGMLRVGPQSAGATPGPACYMRGGSEPTVTDAYVTLGYIPPDHFLGGRMRISAELANQTIRRRIAEPLGISIEQAALGICRVVNERMINGILDMTVRRGIDPRELAIVTGGGATPVAVASLAHELGIKRVIIPRTTAVLCAFGALNADIMLSSVASRTVNSTSFDYAAINSMLEHLESLGSGFLDKIDTAAEARRFEYFSYARYPFQVTELEIPLRDSRVGPQSLQALVEDFHASHLARYKTADPASPVEFVMWRQIARCVIPKIAVGAHSPSKPVQTPIGEHQVYFENGSGFEPTPFYDGERLPAGYQIEGPAIIILPDTTILVPSTWTMDTSVAGYFTLAMRS